MMFKQEFMPRNEQIWQLRQDDPKLSYRVIGKKFGLSKERVRQIICIMGMYKKKHAEFVELQHKILHAPRLKK